MFDAIAPCFCTRQTLQSTATGSSPQPNHTLYFASAIGCAKVPRIVNGLHHLLRIKSRLIYMLLAVFIANILAAGAGFSAPTDWIQHEKNHLAALHDPHFQDATPSAPDQPAGKVQSKHDCHASHFFQSHVATKPLIFLPSVSISPSALRVSLVLHNTAEAPFRPPR